MTNQRNIQILVETMTRCGGNCSGCALSSVERMDTIFDFENFVHKTNLVQAQLDSVNVNEIESITIFLGQGDHFLMKNEEIQPFMEACGNMIPSHLKSKTVVFITASAIGKYEQIKEKMDLFYSYSLNYDIPFFIQVVFDPKKMKLTQKFKYIYIKNILYFKEKCGMTEVTVNMGEDLLNFMNPLEFHQWIKEYKFKHIEMNWVTNQFTYQMWKSIYNDMYQWLEQWLTIYLTDPVYEINFLPFMSRHFLKKETKLMKLSSEIQDSFRDNLYIDYQGNFFPSQMGIISNLTPFGQRISKNILKNPEEMTRKVISALARKSECSSCEYQSVCALSGTTAIFDYKENNHLDNECPWNIKSFLTFFEKNIIHHIKEGRDLKTTIFNKNPVQSELLIKDKNETFEYFENAIDSNLTKPVENTL